MFIIAAILTLIGAVGATAAAVTEAPRFARWYCRAAK